MKKLFALTLVLLIAVFLFGQFPAHAQMMGGYPNSSTSASNSDTQAQLQEEQEGKNLLDQLNSKSTTCQNLTDADFEKIGEYLMGQSVGNTQTHIVMNNRIKSMMGQQGEEQMHIALGKRGSGCDANANFAPMMGGGDLPMMGLNNGYGGMMNGGFGILGIIIWLVVLIDLILIGVWLWKQINRK